MPRSHSRGDKQAVKDVRRVTEVERVGSSEREIGAKRVSSKALHEGFESVGVALRGSFSTNAAEIQRTL